jgi:type IV pilus assembly protein PilW
MKTSTTARRQRPSARPRAGGFSLIEIMVGLVIAMIGVIIMTEALLNSEERSRTTGSGNDAFSNGAIMMQSLQRDLQQGGYGINSLKLLGCNVTTPSGDAVPMSPVVINPAVTLVPAGDANTDRVLVFYGNDDGQPEGNTINSVTGNVYSVQAATAFHVDDYVVGHTGSCSTALTMSKVTALTTTTVTVAAGVAGATVLYNLGRTPKAMAYRVRNASLESCDFMAASAAAPCSTNGGQWVAVAGNIVSLQATYGRDTSAAGSMDGVPDVWDQTTPTSACGWARTAGVRLALVARSNQYESKVDTTTGARVCDQVTAAAPTWNNGTTNASITLSGNADWQCYRYKTFENIAPSRNIVWMGNSSSC